MTATDLFNAARDGDADTVVRLLAADEKRTLVNTTCDSSWALQACALHTAAKNGRFAILHSLIEHHACINQVDEFGWSALHFAAYQGQPEIVAHLLQCGADPALKTTREWSHTIAYIYSDKVSIGRTPRDLAAYYGHDSVMHWLEKFDVKRSSSSLSTCSITRSSSRANSTRAMPEFGEPAEENPVMWAISYSQLNSLESQSQDTLCDMYPSGTIHDVNRTIIRPVCDRHGVSYARAVNLGRLLPAEVFVSHCWGEAFAEFMASVQRAFQTWVHKPNLWICATALLQSRDPDKVASQVGTGTDPDSAPFTAALMQTPHMLVVRNSSIDLHTRIWCVWELFTASQLGLFHRPGFLLVTGPNTFPLDPKHPVDFMMANSSNAVDKVRIVQKILDFDGAYQQINDIIGVVKDPQQFP